jgi:hypothetical protein
MLGSATLTTRLSSTTMNSPIETITSVHPRRLLAGSGSAATVWIASAAEDSEAAILVSRDLRRSLEVIAGSVLSEC